MSPRPRYHRQGLFPIRIQTKLIGLIIGGVSIVFFMLYYTWPHHLLQSFTLPIPATAVAVSTHHNLVMVGDEAGNIAFWRLDTGEMLTSTFGHRGRVTDLYIDTPHTLALSSGHDGTLAWWDIATGTLIQRQHVLPDGNAITALALTSKSSVVLVSGANGHIAALDKMTGARSYHVQAHPVSSNPGAFYTVEAIAMNASGSLMVTGASDSSITIWDTKTATPLTHLNKEGWNPVTKLVFLTNDEVMAIFASTLTRTWTVSTHQQKAAKEIEAWDLPSMTFSPNGQRFARGGSTYAGAPLSGVPFIGDVDSSIYIQDTATFGTIATLSGHQDSVTCLAFSEDGQILVSGSRDGTVRIWRIAE
jgi:WD40 repeat protein